MFKLWKKKTKVEPEKPKGLIRPEAKVFDEFAFVDDKEELVRTLIKMYLKDYHLHKSPPKGIKKMPRVQP